MNMNKIIFWLNKWRIWVVVSVCAVLAGIGVLVSLSGSASPKYKTVNIDKGSIIASVAASGTLSPVVSVQVGSQVSGQIKELFADFNTEVKQGQLIARIDPETFEYKVRQAQADLDASRAQYLIQRAEALRQDVNLANAKRDYDRNLQLYAKNFISAAARDTSQATYSALFEQVRGAKAQVVAASATIKQKEALLSQAKIDLERTAIRAPVNGIVIKRSIEKGQTVAASLQAPELFVIAENLTDMQVDTAIDEAEIGRIRDGQKATFTVDAFPGRTFEGTVKQIRKSAQSVSNVVTYTVTVTAANPAQELLPGMTANVRIVTDTRDDVLRVPNAALRFKPVGAATRTSASSKGNAGAAQIKALRERLDKDLRPDDAQKARLNAIFNAMQDKLSNLRNVQEADRKKLADRARSEMLTQIGEILTPEQKKAFDEINAESAKRRAAGAMATGRVFLMDNNSSPKEVLVRVGLTDGTMTEVASPELKEGMHVIVGTQTAGAAKAEPPRAGPRMF